VVRCTGTTNGAGVATCFMPTTIITLAAPYTATTPVSANYFAGSGTGIIKLL
jgi:hypothetical protein